MTDNKQTISDPYWKCRNYGKTIQVAQPPEECQAYHEKCVFLNVICYTPECGFIRKDLRLK